MSGIELKYFRQSFRYRYRYVLQIYSDMNVTYTRQSNCLFNKLLFCVVLCCFSGEGCFSLFSNINWVGGGGWVGVCWYAEIVSISWLHHSYRYRSCTTKEERTTFSVIISFNMHPFHLNYGENYAISYLHLFGYVKQWIHKHTSTNTWLR